MTNDMTVNEVAAEMGVTVATVRRWINDRGLPARRHTPASMSLRISRDDLDAWVDDPAKVVA